MNLRLQAIQIDPNNPFDRDLLNRKVEIENLSMLIRNMNSPAVLAIDSRWGTGKTTFIKMWEQYLKMEGLESLYFNAWSTDFSEDPLLSFLGEMNEGLESLFGKSTASRKAWTKAKTVGTQICKRGLPAIIKIATAGMIDADKIIEDELSKAMESLTGDALENYLKQKKAITDFHEALTQLIESSSNGNPVVIFVDELDRCRPTYAIALLERIKHLFNIEGLVFVLALDKSQLSHSLSAVYGDGIDSNGYLRRFIDFEYQLKLPEKKDYINSLFAALSLDEYFNLRKKYPELQSDRVYLFDVFLLLAEHNKLSLREIEQLLASINLALRTAKENEYIHPALLAFLVVTKNVNPDQYQQYISESNSEKMMIDYLYSIIPEKKRLENHECAVLEGFLIAAKKGYHQGNLESLDRHKTTLAMENISYEIKGYSETVVNAATRPVAMGHGVDLKTLVERIEMLSQFKFSEDDS